MSARAFTRRCGAYLALAALALQLVLSFSHIHEHDLAVPRIDRTDIVGVTHARPGLHFAERLPARLIDDDENCPICFSGFLLSNSSLPDAPSSLNPLQFAEIDRAFNPVSDQMVRPRNAAFRSRAPPAV
jgi:hypothetical protein